MGIRTCSWARTVIDSESGDDGDISAGRTRLSRAVANTIAEVRVGAKTSDIT